MKRRHILTAMTTSLSLAWALPAVGQGSYPDRPVRVVVAVPAGGSIDMVARLLSQQLSEVFKESFVVENKAGGAGIIGTNWVAKAAPDGYTLGLAPAAFIATNASLFANLPYDPAKDFSPVSKLVNQSMVLTVRAESPYKNVQDLIQAAKQNSGKMTFGSGGDGSPHHLSGVLFANKAGVNLIHVPYKGGAPAQTDLLGGHVDMVFGGLPEVLSNIRAGKLRGLAILAPERSPLLPDVPTLAESGLDGVELSAWMGLVAPAGTPDEIVKALNEKVVMVLNGAAKEKLAEVGLEASPSTPAEFQQLIQDEIALHQELIKAAGIKPQ